MSITHLYPSVAEVIQVIGTSSVLNKWAANIGARDGVSHNDEIFELYDKLGYTGVAVEADAAFKETLKGNLPEHVKTVMEFATPDTIARILHESAAPLELDVFKLDIDGL